MPSTPTIIACLNPSEPQGSTSLVHAEGAGFVTGATFAFSGTGVSITSSGFNSSGDYSLVVVIDSGATIGARDLTVTNPDTGTGTGVGVFTVTGPPINLIPPILTGPSIQGEILPVAGVTWTCEPGVWTGAPTFAYQWYDFSGSPFSGETAQTFVVPASELHISTPYCVVTATNGAGSVSAQSDEHTAVVATYFIVPPVITGSLVVGGTLTCSTGTWIGDTNTYTYEWSGTAGTSTSSTYVVESGDVGNYLLCTVTATNDNGSWVQNASINSPATAATGPTNTVLPVITGTTEGGHTLTCSTGTWTGDTPTFTYEWVGAGNATGAQSLFSSNNFYDLSVGPNTGMIVSCVVTATNDAGVSTVVPAFVGPITSAPYDWTAPAVVGVFNVGNPIACSQGIWAGDDSDTTYAYKWQTSAPTTLGTDPFYVLQEADLHQFVQCVVTATNDLGSTTVSTDLQYVNASGSPTNTAAPTLSGDTSLGDTLTCDPGTWVGDATITYTYTWIAAGGFTPTVDTYVLESGDVGGFVSCVVTATNGAGAVDHDSASVGPIDGGISTPTVTSCSPDQEQGATADETVVGTGFVNGCFASFSGSGITVNSVTFNSDTSLTVNITIAGDAPVAASTVTVTNPDSGAGTSGDIFSVESSGGGTPPTNTVLPVITGTGVEGDTLTCSSGTWTGDPTITYAYSWNNTDNGSSTDTYVLDSFDVPSIGVGNVLSCTVTATNGAGTDTATSAGVGPYGAGGGDGGVTVTSVSPGSLPQGTSATLTVTGTAFASGAVVTMDGVGITVNSSSYVNATTILVNITVASDATIGICNVTVTNTDAGTATGAGAFAVDPLNVFTLSAWRWVLSDPAVPESYTFEINPNAGGSLPLQKNLNIYQLTSDDGESVLYEGSDAPQLVVVSGTLLAEAQLNHLIYWYSKRRQIQLTDDLGRTVWVYFTVFTPTRAWSYQYPWRHTWTASFYVIGQQGVTTL